MPFSFRAIIPGLPEYGHCLQIPRSVLVVIHTPDLQVLMMERAGWKDFWQSVTGSVATESEALRGHRDPRGARGDRVDASRYGLSDWGIENRFEIFKRHQSRYAPGVTHNTEHVFSLALPSAVEVTLDPSST